MAETLLREGIDGLADGKRSGRPRVFAAEVVTEVKAMVCAPPSEREVPLSRGVGLRRAPRGWWPRCRPPRCVDGWPRTRSSRGSFGRGSSRDPDFAAKAGRVLDLYERVWEGEELG
jgi:hypothetical protein